MSEKAVAAFLDFLEKDMMQNQQHVEAVSVKRWEEIWNLVDGVDVDLDAPLTDEEE